MKLRTVIFITLLLTFTALGDTGINQQLKEKLKVEVKGLQTEINNAAKDIVQLRKDKAALSTTLYNMEEWGNSQEEAKLQYYETAGKLDTQINKITIALTNEKKHNEKILLKYYRLKKIMGCLVGGLLAALYVIFGSRIVTLLVPVLGPWGAALQYLGPVAVYGIGYVLTLLIF